MGKSEFPARLDSVQAQFTGVLRPIGFRKAGRSFNRTTPEGLVQVVNLQISRPDPIPPQLRAGRSAAPSDKFTVNLGVWIPEVARHHLPGPRSKTVQEYDCHIRARLGEFATPASDIWWSLDERWADAATESVELLCQKGLPFLDRMSTRDGIVADWVERASDSRIVVALVEAARGNRAEATQLLSDQVTGTRNILHHTYVKQIASELGLDVSGQSIPVTPDLEAI